jgi:TNF receptor-associated factor 4
MLKKKKAPISLPDSIEAHGSATPGDTEAARSHPKTVTHQGKQIKAHGYYCNLVHPPPKHTQIYCALCHGILCDPCQTTCCGEGFCHGCLEQLIQTHSPCPGCWAVGYDWFHNDALQKNLKKIEVYCPHENEGCPWSGTMKRLKTHLHLYNTDNSKTCGWIRVACSLCSKEVPRNIMKRHMSESCMQRRYQCQYCGDFKSTFQDVVNNHRPVCRFTPVTCPNECGESVMQVDLESHVNNDCPRKVVYCEFKAFGCSTQMHRQNIPQHMTDRSV